VPLKPSDEFILMFRDGVSAASRMATITGSVMTFLDRMMFADDWDEQEGKLESSQVSARYGDAVPHVVLDALRYFQDVTNVLVAARTAKRASDAAWFAVDLCLPFQTHINLANELVRKRARGTAQAFVDATERQAAKLISAGNDSEKLQAEAIARLSLLKDDWRKEASDIVEALDSAMPSLDTAV
jgi:hypothetical protein